MLRHKCKRNLRHFNWAIKRLTTQTWSFKWRSCAYTWWRHQIEPYSALLALCAGNLPVPVNSPHKGQSRGALIFSLVCARINDWVNNREAGDLRRHRGHYDVNAYSRHESGNYCAQMYLSTRLCLGIKAQCWLDHRSFLKNGRWDLATCRGTSRVTPIESFRGGDFSSIWVLKDKVHSNLNRYRELSVTRNEFEHFVWKMHMFRHQCLRYVICYLICHLDVQNYIHSNRSAKKIIFAD